MFAFFTSYSIADIPLPASMVIGCTENMIESRLDLVVRRHEKLKDPKGLSQKVRDTAVIHNQASPRPCIRQRGITPSYLLV